MTGAPVASVTPPANVREPPPPTAPIANPPREVQTTWNAKVKKADGIALPVGTPCTLRATLKSDGGVSVAFPDLDLRCGGESLYRSGDDANGFTTTSTRVFDFPGDAPGSYRAGLLHTDQGDRGPRAQVAIDTHAGTATAWKANASPYRVELAIDELSAPWTGQPLYAREDGKIAAFTSFVKRCGHATHVESKATVKQGAACSVAVQPLIGDPEHNCRVLVRCGDITLYGEDASGLNECALANGAPVSVDDKDANDGDPELKLRLAENQLVVGDSGIDRWSVAIALDPPSAACH